jgi:hypothetical protein
MSSASLWCLGSVRGSAKRSGAAHARHRAGSAPAWVIGLIFFAGGCTSSKDVSKDVRYHRGFVPGQIYVLKVDAAVFRVGNPECVLDPADESQSQAYRGVPVAQQLPAGSRIHIDKLVHTTVSAPIQGESYVEVFVTPLDQPPGCNRIRLGYGLSQSKVFRAPNTWPTILLSPDPAKLSLDSGSDGATGPLTPHGKDPKRE